MSFVILVMEKRIWDSLRRKYVAFTPEEQVRQWFISVLKDVCGVPEHLMGSEVPLKIGAKRQRADIVVFGRDASPVAVVECKRPDVEIDADVLAQAARYNLSLDIRWIFLTNGRRTVALKRMEDGSLVNLPALPGYEEMAAGKVSAGGTESV